MGTACYRYDVVLFGSFFITNDCTRYAKVPGFVSFTGGRVQQGTSGCRGEAYTIAEDAGSNKLTIVPALGPQPLRNRKRGDLREIFTVMKRSNADPDRIRLLDDVVKRSTAVHIGNPGELILTDKRLDSVQNAAFCRNLGCRFGGMQNKTVLIEKLRSQCIWILRTGWAFRQKS
ncbi:hypothetical protein DW954_09890 [Clostridium sp. AM45-5]|nr:hypothetical protein [Clostridium sp. AM45-5]RHS65769.1 hypothetical protein DW954_09890 [Clostridium sp. AM45-5]